MFQEQTAPPAGSRCMTEDDFRSLGGFLYDAFGLKMGPTKKAMLEARLSKRLKALGLHDFGSYCRLVFSPGGQEAEVPHLVDAATTNTTEFFREPRHFQLLLDKALPALLGPAGGRAITVWSAGCASGEEPYTLAMVLAEAASRRPGLDYGILATDICNRVLAQAQAAIYPEERAGKIPPVFRRQYLLRSRQRQQALVRVAPEIRRRVRFSRLNLMDDFQLDKPVEVIFCRNVVIYFDRATQVRLFSRFCRNLVPGGFLFIGHSESLGGMGLPLEQVAPAMYRRTP